MRLPQKFLTLPTSLLLLLLCSSPTHSENKDPALAEWPHENYEKSKDSAEDSLHRSWELETIKSHIQARHVPVAVKKMSEDESEKFFPEYWGFHEQADQFAIFGKALADGGAGWSPRKEFEEEDSKVLTNTSMELSMRPPFLVRTRQESASSQRDIQAFAVGRVKTGRSAAAVLALLEKRQFACPPGTSACSNAPNLCCATGETCVPVNDTGIGKIGCCPAGFSCSGTIQCVAGNTPCDSSIGGGCCIPGYICATIGCVPSSAINSAVTPVTTLTKTSSITTVVNPFIPASTSTLTLATSASITAVTTNTATASSFVTPSTISTMTSVSSPMSTSSTSDTAKATTTSATADSSCPTGFYACSAYYAGGCCRTGRDCETTNCPSTAYTTLISSGVTIVVPLTGAATTTASGTCATGWYNCGATGGGNCCPSGWSCGSESCTILSATSTGIEAKEGLLFSGGHGLATNHLHLLSALSVMLLILFIG